MAKKLWDFECPQYIDFERELDSSGKDDIFFGIHNVIVPFFVIKKSKVMCLFCLIHKIQLLLVKGVL